jgi:hypothetical protein
MFKKILMVAAIGIASFAVTQGTASADDCDYRRGPRHHHHHRYSPYAYRPPVRTPYHSYRYAYPSYRYGYPGYRGYSGFGTYGVPAYGLRYQSFSPYYRGSGISIGIGF